MTNDKAQHARWTDNKIITDCMEWALAHGYNPYDSTVSLPSRRAKLYFAYNALTKNNAQPQLLKALKLHEEADNAVNAFRKAQLHTQARDRRRAAIAKAEGIL